MKKMLKWMKNHFPIRIKIQILRPFADDCDTYIAYDSEDAKKAYAESVDEPRDPELDPLEPISLNSKLTIFSEDLDGPWPLFSTIKDHTVTAPAWAWALWNGRGFLCSTEY
jgi:hypothetical protein